MVDNTQEETPKPLRRVRIQNDGGPGYATRITDADTGQFIDGIFHVRLVDIDVRDVPRAILWMHMPVVDVIAHAEVVDCCRYCGQQKPDPKKQGDEFRLKTTINDTDLDFSIDKLKQVQDLQRATRGNNIYPAEALIAFTEWVRTRWGDYLPDSFRDLITMFCEAQGWKFNQEYYDEVIERIKANYPE